MWSEEDFGMTKPQRSVALSAAVLFFLIAAGTATAQTTATVFIPGNTLGDFGNPSVDGNQPYVTGIVATGPGTIVVTYLSGTVTDCCPELSTGPDGTPFDFGSGQSALQEAAGIAGGTIDDLDALIGIFVPQSSSSPRILASGWHQGSGTCRSPAVHPFLYRYWQEAIGIRGRDTFLGYQ
jgi:hypothetical protein